jgi:hypothetical protein
MSPKRAIHNIQHGGKRWADRVIYTRINRSRDTSWGLRGIAQLQNSALTAAPVSGMIMAIPITFDSGLSSAILRIVKPSNNKYVVVASY